MSPYDTINTQFDTEDYTCKNIRIYKYRNPNSILLLYEDFYSDIILPLNTSKYEEERRKKKEE